MSAENIIEAEAADINKCCASCGTAEIDEIKLFKCDDGCDLARYCSDKCQQDHRQIHEGECKERVAKIREEILFRQPESSHLGDCPICFLPMPLDPNKSRMHLCCSKKVCEGCTYVNYIDKCICPFCRQPPAKTNNEKKKKLLKRVKANDPVALHEMGLDLYKVGKYDSAFDHFTRAVAAGEKAAHYHLSLMYLMGISVEKDEKMLMYHGEEAAIAGHPEARFNLGVCEWKKDRFDKALKHWVIAANLGHDRSLQKLNDCYKLGLGLVSKDDLTGALRAHQDAVNATKSPQRERAAELKEKARACGLFAYK